jgi:hypothetical protein
LGATHGNVLGGAGDNNGSLPSIEAGSLRKRHRRHRRRHRHQRKKVQARVNERPTEQVQLLLPKMVSSASVSSSSASFTPATRRPSVLYDHIYAPSEIHRQQRFRVEQEQKANQAKESARNKTKEQEHTHGQRAIYLKLRKAFLQEAQLKQEAHRKEQASWELTRRFGRSPIQGQPRFGDQVF